MTKEEKAIEKRQEKLRRRRAAENNSCVDDDIERWAKRSREWGREIRGESYPDYDGCSDW